ncbi:hypothetical protein [Chthonobacter albigriseus]|uniref:hypothetical protein n=1 Tax=Chthonobacter albigriseus TaxID=1683161 RepID=UPI0015EF8542|nr:hypothetical protein [Chthonobacter albigriseus]
MRLYAVVGKPVQWLLIPIGLSFAAYFVPQDWYGRRWLGASDVDHGYAVLALAVIYLVLAGIVVAASALASAAVPLRPAIRQIDGLTTVWLVIVTALAAVGTTAAVGKAISEVGISGAWALISGGLANELKHALYEDYSAGVMSLRYLVVLAAPASIAIGLITRWRRPIILLAAINVGLMLVVALLSSRLTLIASVVVLMMTMARYGSQIRVRQAVAGGVALVVALIVLSNTRNINFYQEQLGVDSPVLAGLADTLTYLASPAHGSLVGADYVAGGDLRRSGIDSSLTTNSAVMQSAGMRWWLLVYYGVILGVNTLFFFSAYRSRRLEMIVGGAAASYAFWEFWRINLFYEGIHMVWILFGIVLPFALHLGHGWLRDSLQGKPAHGLKPGPARAAIATFHHFFPDGRSPAASARRRRMPRGTRPGPPFRGLPEFHTGGSTDVPMVDLPRRRPFGSVSEAIMADRRALEAADRLRPPLQG